MSDEIIFPDSAEKIKSFTEKLVDNLKKEGLEAEQTRTNEERHVSIKKSFFFKGEITSSKKEKDLRISFERRGEKTTFGLILGPTIILLILAFLLNVSYLMFGAIILLCVGQMLISRKMKEVGQDIRNAIGSTIESFPQLREHLEEQQEEQRQERLEKAEDTYFCPKCQKEFMVPELVSLHLERKHDIRKRELTEEDFEEGNLKEEIRTELGITEDE